MTSLTTGNAVEFLRHLRTWNEAEGQIQPYPIEKAYLTDLTDVWIDHFNSGKRLIIEKCRRMVVSWWLRGLELYVGGLQRSDQLIVGLDYEAASRHLWRIKHLYDDLSSQYPEWKLPKYDINRAKGERQIESFRLANGTEFTIGNSEADAIQGEGKTIITLEELSKYRYPSSIWAQAKIVTQGSANHPGGFVVSVNNSSSHPDWQRIKKG